jgi:pentose-5-phosphate-3-epimerase
MSIICPTITAKTKADFKRQLQLVSGFAERVHLDIADNIFAPRLLDIKKIKLPEIATDVHVMYEFPGQVIEKLIRLKPNLVIIHFESDANFREISYMLRANDIKFGVALLQQTDVSVLDQFKDIIDHVLIFSGNLGFFGGNLDINLIHKAAAIKKLNSNIEIGWDGGINLTNAKILADNNIDVLNVGGYIHNSKNPKKSYDTLVDSLGRRK